jgi:hypothetical protein
MIKRLLSLTLAFGLRPFGLQLHGGFVARVDHVSQWEEWKFREKSEFHGPILRGHVHPPLFTISAPKFWSKKS